MSKDERPVLRHGWRRRPPRVARVDTTALGVHPGEHGTPGYVGRPADEDLDRLVADDHPLTLVAGPRLAGSSRALTRAAVRHVPDHRLVLFPETVRGDLGRLVDRAARWTSPFRSAVLWLDDAHLGLLSQLDADLLAAVPSRVSLLATTREAVLESGALPERAAEVIAPRRVAVRPGDLAGGLPPRRHVAAALDRARAQLAPRPRHAARVALLRAAVDWDRHQIPFPLDRRTLRQLALLYCHDLEPTRPDDREAALDSLLDGVGRGWLTVSVRDGAPHYRPHPLLTAAADEPDSTWTPSDAVRRAFADLPAGDLASAQLMGTTRPEPATPGSPQPLGPEPAGL